MDDMICRRGCIRGLVAALVVAMGFPAYASTRRWRPIGGDLVVLDGWVLRPDDVRALRK